MKPEHEEFLEAVKRGDADKVQQMLQQGLDMNSFPDPHPLTVAGRYGHLEVVKALVSAGANVNKMYSGEPPLVTAAWSGRIPVVQFLLSSGADVNGVARHERNTALMKAAGDGRAETVEILLAAGAWPEARNDNGFTALMFAAKSGYYKVARLLLDNKAQIQAKNKAGLTAFDLAVKYRNVPVAELLNPEAKEEMLGCDGKKYRITSPTGTWKTFKENMADEISNLPGCFTSRKFHYEFWHDPHGIMPHMIINVFENSIGICDLGASEELWNRLKTLIELWSKRYKYDPALTLTSFS